MKIENYASINDKKIRIRFSTMSTLTNPDGLFLCNFVRKITSDIVDNLIRHSLNFAWVLSPVDLNEVSNFT